MGKEFNQITKLCTVICQLNCVTCLTVSECGVCGSDYMLNIVDSSCELIIDDILINDSIPNNDHTLNNES